MALINYILYDPDYGMQVQMIQLDTAYSRTDRAIHWYVNDRMTTLQPNLPAYISQTAPLYLGGTPNTVYQVHAIIYYDNFTQSVTIGPISINTGVGLQRPAYFYWDRTISSGGEFKLNASEWNRLAGNINAVRTYKGFSVQSFTTAYTGGVFYAYMFNEFANSIRALTTTAPPNAASGSYITAYALNQLRISINSIS